MREIFVSGYGSENAVTISKYRFSDDWMTAERIWQDGIESPSFLSIADDMCFAISEKEKSAEFFCYKKEASGYVLKDRMVFDGGALCHIYYSSKHKTLYGACYLTGHVMAAALEDYRFAGVRSYFIMKPDKNGDLTRAHCCVPDNDENRIFVCNIALDRVYGYNIQNGALTENVEFPYIQLEKGEGPRHIRFHPHLDVAYVITEYSNKIFTMAYDTATGRLDILQEISTLPSGFDKKSFGSTLAFSPDGRYVYAANRGANTICVFRTDNKGLLQKIQDFDCFGNWPRHIEVTADGRCLLSANQESGGVSVISICEVDGMLERHISDIPFATPSYVADITMNK